MKYKGYEWRRMTHRHARMLWREGFRGEAYLLFQAVIRDARKEAKAT